MKDRNSIPSSEELDRLSNQELDDRGLTGAKPEDNEDKPEEDAK